jgi:SulP family sulfate permease
MSFGSIIYRDEAFAPYMPVLIKLTVVSGMVHQVCFSTFSTLPFAVGQVQDAGLIFLSSMARSIVQYCQNQGYDDEALLATVTIGLGIATALLGFALVLIGKFALAQYVQMLPTCVIGGYLAFIGWFCGMSGLELMAGGGDLSLKLIANSFVFLLPGIMGGMLIYVLVRRLRHMAVLPTCIAVIFLTFYIALHATGTSVEDATDMGWIPKTDAPPVWYRTWDYLKFDKVVWRALPSQTLTLMSMIFVVALSSSLDVAAIELELNHPLDYNHELKTVGLSNIVSGLTGGYTGSYIFSQSIFSLRYDSNVGTWVF